MTTEEEIRLERKVQELEGKIINLEDNNAKLEDNNVKLEDDNDKLEAKVIVISDNLQAIEIINNNNLKIVASSIQLSYARNNSPRMVKALIYQSLIKISETINVKIPNKFVINNIWYCSFSCIQKFFALLPLIPGTLIKKNRKVIRWKRSNFLEFVLRIAVNLSEGELVWGSINKPITGKTLKPFMKFYASDIIELNGQQFIDYTDSEYRLKIFLNNIKKNVREIKIIKFVDNGDITQLEVPEIEDIGQLQVPIIE